MHLRHIAVYVEEPEAGNFCWVLTENNGRAWHTLERSTSPQTTYKAAMAAGLIALQGLVEDLEAGPRAGDAPPPSSPTPTRSRPGRRTKETEAPEQINAPPKTYFGFGPAR